MYYSKTHPVYTKLFQLNFIQNKIISPELVLHYIFVEFHSRTIFLLMKIRNIKKNYNEKSLRKIERIYHTKEKNMELK